MSDSLLISRDGPVTTLTLNRPAVRNAVDGATMLALRDAVEACAGDGTTRVIVLAGAGGAFCSGADLTLAAQPGISPEAAWRVLGDAYHPALLAIHGSRWPVIAAVDGVAAGLGCDLALACDMRLASARAQFAELFIRVGLIPDGGGTWSLPRLVGLGRALELMYTGASVGADEARAIGLANQVYPAERFAAEVAAYAARLAEQAPLALTRIRQAARAAQESSFAESLAREAALQREILTSADGFEGFRAFLEKRRPRWQGE
ncbi:enoyl-CoA hydratase/isomerase family protein [Kouleothrix sp.]|uniref:enoyl-CoA hydratase/isomerase family protein n=1 Tax=Kouleothrix sp. TaxID=2779161 RepID=UPI00391A6E0B